jgi:hypothetical protein
MCNKPATEINEIVLRVRSKTALDDYKNRVTLCGVCHTNYHIGGATKSKMLKMTKKRQEFLFSIGRGDYI